MKVVQVMKIMHAMMIVQVIKDCARHDGYANHKNCAYHISRCTDHENRASHEDQKSQRLEDQKDQPSRPQHF